MTEKLERLQRILADWRLDALLLTRRDNIAWLTEGGSYYVVERAQIGVASLLITPTSVLLLAPENELPRILAEEPMPFSCEIQSYPWYQSLETVLANASPGIIGSDMPFPSTQDIQLPMVQLRQGLNDAEKQRFRALGREAAGIVEQVARQLRAGVTERAVEAEIVKNCLERGIRPVCTLIAADERIAAYKHPVPGAKRLKKQLMMTLGAERAGLNVSLTRMVHLGQPAADLRQRILTLAEIHADILMATAAGRRWQEVFADIQQAYQRHGWPEGWRSHHQGGPAGYDCRDWIVTGETLGAVMADTAQAWNPTLSGVKSEDTALLTAKGVEWLTRSDAWPLIEVVRGDKRWQIADWLFLPSS